MGKVTTIQFQTGPAFDVETMMRVLGDRWRHKSENVMGTEGMTCFRTLTYQHPEPIEVDRDRPDESLLNEATYAKLVAEGHAQPRNAQRAVVALETIAAGDGMKNFG